jgi:hypothetical protein
MSQKKTGIELISEEREKQLTTLGRTVELDVINNNEFQLTDAASALSMAFPEGTEGAYFKAQGDYPPIGWDSERWKNMVEKPYKERLIIAGALIAAEIDRIEN